MKIIGFQKKNGLAVPFTKEDEEAWAEYKENQVTKHKVTGSKKERSWPQLKKLHAVLRTVVEQTEDNNWSSLAKAKLSLKVNLNYIDDGVIVVDKQNNVIVQYRSFGYLDLPHMEACDLFNRAWPILADVLGVSVEELLNNSD
jgi:hypothetical protein